MPRRLATSYRASNASQISNFTCSTLLKYDLGEPKQWVVLRAGTPSEAGGQQSSADATLPLRPLPLSPGRGLGQKE